MMKDGQNLDNSTETSDVDSASTNTNSCGNDSDDSSRVAEKEGEPKSRFPDLEELQQQVAKRIKSNRKFLETYLIEDIDAAADDMDLPDDEESIADDEESSGDETFEEL
jgi:hypothetical protein